MDYKEYIGKILGDGGVLAKELPGYKARPGQLRMAGDVADAIQNGHDLVVEAGTGTGKTFAYLLPSIISKKKVLVSTQTRNLQDQISEKDLPRLIGMLGDEMQIRTAVLKGRTGYLCLKRMDDLEAEQKVSGFQETISFGDGGAVKSRNSGSEEKNEEEFRKLQEFASRSETGDLDTLRGVPASSMLLNFVRSSKYTCVGQKCPHAQDCFVNRARARALEADITVVNHALYFIGRKLDVDSNHEAKILPDADVVVFDEAHSVEQTARGAFSDRFSSREADEMLKEIRRALLQLRKKGGASSGGKAGNDTDRAFDELENAVSRVRTSQIEFRNALQETMTAAGEKGPYGSQSQANLAPLMKSGRCADAGKALLADVRKLRALLLVLAAPDDGSVGETAKAYADLSAEISRAAVLRLEDGFSKVRGVFESLSASFAEAASLLETLFNGIENDNVCVFAECFASSFAITSAPVDVSESFRKYVLSDTDAVRVFTSATMAVADSADPFSHFKRSIGLSDTAQDIVPSPFNYEEQGLIYVPCNLPDVKSSDRIGVLSRLMAGIIGEVPGGVFVLCTSRSAMTGLYRELSKLLRGRRVLVQDEESRSSLVETFIREKNAVLVATKSFWEGVDVPGDTLSAVFIDKFPFPAFNSPVEKAVSERYEKMRKGSSFRAISLPECIIALRQGVGRLIRTVNDSGIIVLFDPRIEEGKSYIRTIMESLPPCRVTNDYGDVRKFWSERRFSREKKE